VIILVFIIKKVIKSIFLKKNQNWFQPTSFCPVRFLEQKPVQTGLARFFKFGSIFLVWLGFGSFFTVLSVWVWFGLVFSV